MITKEEKKIKFLELENEELRHKNAFHVKTIDEYNKRISAVPIIKDSPKNVVEGLRVMAKFFNTLQGGEEDQVQKDLLKWAKELEERGIV